MRLFHAKHPDVALQINVVRHAYSFLGGSTSATGERNKRSTWHDGLLGYVGGDEARRDEAERGLQAQGREAGIKFDFNVYTHWQVRGRATPPKRSAHRAARSRMTAPTCRAERSP
jgi:hypothetical protein